MLTQLEQVLLNRADISLPNQSGKTDPRLEQSFQDWYKNISRQYKLDPDPDNPLHFYDYRAAWRAGASPDADAHWPSEFKLEGHPNLIVDGRDTRTGVKVQGLEQTLLDKYKRK